MAKLEVLVGPDWKPVRHANSYSIERTRGPARLVIAPSGQHLELVVALIEVLRSPFALLYVLHTARAGAANRYQSPPLDLADLAAFLTEYSPFLAADARHDLWMRSQPDSATLVWDRHDLVYAYGPLERFEDVLTRRAFHRGDVAVPTPHRHHYHPEWDRAEQAILRSFTWIVSPLRPEDEQPQGAV